jgi:precorrin-6B methylase 1
MEPCDITTQHTTSYEVVMLHPTQGTKEVIPSSDRETPSDIAAHSTQEGVKGSKKRCKQHLQGTMATTGGNNDEAGSFGVRLNPTAACNDKR